MPRQFIMGVLLSAALPLAIAHPAHAQPPSREPVALSDSLGMDIDKAERDRYHLFPDVDGFINARFSRDPDGRYHLTLSRLTAVGPQEQTLRLPKGIWETARQHTALVDQYLARRRAPVDTAEAEAEWEYRLGLKYATRGRYDLSQMAVDDLLAEFPGSRAAGDAAAAHDVIVHLRQTRRALFLPGGLHDRSGRTDLMIFAGYYGAWVGVATPIALKSESEVVFGSGLILGAPAGLLIANALSRDADISRGRASMISLGGHLGTWQGIGWAAVGDAEGEGVIGAGLAGGLGGIVLASVLTSGQQITEGHGALASMALPWGAWYGLMVAGVADLEDNDVLSAALIGSDALVMAALVGGRNLRMSQARSRWINLGGVCGILTGAGLLVIAQSDDAAATCVMLGLSSAAGLGLAVHLSRNYDAGKDLSCRPRDEGEPSLSIVPRVRLDRESGDTTFVPGAVVSLRF